MGSKKQQTIGYRYKLGIHLIGCHGPVDNVSEFLADKKIAWSGSSSGGIITVNAEDLFGGDEKEGGVSGQIYIEMGLPSQGQNSYLASNLLPSLVPNFRGLLGFVFKSFYIGTQTYLKKLSFRATRIHLRENGIVQWYDAKSEISFAGVLGDQLGPTSEGWSYLQVTLSDNSDYSSDTFDYSSWAIGQTPFANQDGHPYSEAGGYPAIKNTNWDINTKIWVRKNFTVATIAGFSLTVFVDNYATVWVNGILVLQRSGSGNVGSTENFMHEVVVPSEVLRTGLNSIVLLAEDYGVYSYVAFKISSQDKIHKDMNPAHIIRECLTNPDWGMGYTDSNIDDTSFTKAADTLYDEAMGMSLLWNQQTEIEDFIKLVIRHIDAVLFVDRHTGKFNLKLVRNDYNELDLMILDESSISKLENFTRPQFGELTNSVTVKYWDALNNVDATTTIQDIALAQMQGVTIGVTNEYPGFTYYLIAAKVAQRDMKTLSSAIASCTIYAKRSASVLNIGDVFKLSWSDLDVNQLVMRIASIDYGDGKNNQVRIQCTEDIYGLPSVSLVAPPVLEWKDPNVYPISATNRLIYEVPYLEAVQQYSQNEIDALILADSNVGYAGATAKKPESSFLNANMYVDSGAGYKNETTIDFCPAAKLTASIDKMAISFNINNAINIESAIDGSWFQINNEIMVKVSYLEPTLTVKRGALDTVPENHNVNSILYFWDNFASNDDNKYLVGESLNIKLATVSGLGELPLAAAPIDVLNIVGRMAKPYPPGNFKINNLYFPLSAIDNLDLTWAHRDKKLQTGGSYLGFLDSSIGPESGTTYNIRIYNNNNNSLIYQELDYSGNSFSAQSRVYTSSIKIELESIREGLQSYQKYSHVMDYINSETGNGGEGSGIKNLYPMIYTANVPIAIIKTINSVETKYSTFESYDGGLTFQQTGNATLAPISENIAFVATLNSGVYISVDENGPRQDQTLNEIFLTRGVVGSAPEITSYSFIKPHFPAGIGTDGNRFIIFLDGGEVLQSTDGLIWSSLGFISGIPGVFTQYAGSTNYASGVNILKRANRWFMNYAGFVYYTTNEDPVSGWTLAVMPVVPYSPRPQLAPFRSIVEYQGNLFMMGQRFVSGEGYNIQTILKSSDSGETWVIVLDNAISASDIYEIGGVLIAVGYFFSNKSNISTDGGVTWTKPVNEFVLIQVKYGLFAGDKIYYSIPDNSALAGGLTEKLVYTTDGIHIHNVDLKINIEFKRITENGDTRVTESGDNRIVIT